MLSHPSWVMPLARCQGWLSMPRLGKIRGVGEGMSLAAASSSYPLLNIFWTILEIFLWVIWFWILITVVVYLIARGSKMQERKIW